MSDYNNLFALVSGGASGIGLATARLLYERGARVAVVDVHPADAQTVAAFANDARALFIQADLSQPAAVERAVATAAQTFGQLNAIVNSAGIQRYGNAEQTSLELWREVLDVNLTAAFLLARAALPDLRRSGGAGE